MTTEKYLNEIGDQAISDMKGFYQEWVDRGVAPAALYEAHLYLGLIAWKEKQDDKMLAHFQDAITAALKLYHERLEENYTTEDAIRSVYPLLLFFAFANHDEKVELQTISDSIFLNRQQDERINKLLQYLKKPDKSELSVLGELFTLVVDKSYYLNSMQAFIKGLIAVEQEDDKKIELAIRTLIYLHKNEAINGYLQQRFEGFVCLWAVALQSFCREKYADIYIDSQYIPNVFPTKSHVQKDAKKITFYLE